MPPSSISKATRIASSAAAPSAFRPPIVSSLPPQAGHIPYGNANPSLTFWQAVHRHWAVAVPQQMYSSSPSTGWWHFGQIREDVSAPVAVAPANDAAVMSWVCGWNAATSAAVIGHFLPLDRYVAMDFAARRPAPMARMTVAPPVTMSPP